jgi:uncharacterized membrane protein YgdD (TMEM256/DUF423 family)
MIRAWLGTAAVLGFLSVLAGAVGAHLASGEGAAGLLRTAAAFGVPHAAALVGIAALSQGRATRGLALTVAGSAFALGGLLFCLSLFAMGLTGMRAFGFITPLGGVGLLIGCGALGAYALPFGLNKDQPRR